MKTAFGRKFDCVLRWVRRNTAKPFTFRTVRKLENDDGDLLYALLEQSSRGSFRIKMWRGTSPAARVDTLLHEAAHLNDIVKRGWGKDHYGQHGDSWGVELSRLYRDYHEARDRGEFE